jgi:hypothetical protein
MTPAQVQAFETIRAGLPPDLATLWDDAHLSDALPTPDDDPDDGPLSDPATLAGYTAWRADGRRTFNLHEAEAIANATEQPLGFGIFCSAFAWRLNGGGGWWTKTAPEWADDLGVSVEQFRRVQTVMRRAHLLRRRVGRCNVTSYQLDFDALTALTHAHGEAMGIDFKGLAARFEGNTQTVEQTREKFHSLRDSRKWFEGNPQTRIQGKEYQKPPAHPVDDAAQQDGSREPGEDDEETPEPPAPTSRNTDHEAVIETLARACAAKEIPHDPGEIAAFVKLRDVTPSEAAHAAGVVRNATGPIDRFNYVKSVIENYRVQGRKRDFTTPVGGHADPGTTRRVLADLDSARQRPAAPDAQQQQMDKMRAALKPHSKALSKGN